MTATLLPPTEDSVATVVDALRRGELCVIPTDTVYGVAAVVEPEPVRRLYQAKGRPETRPIPVLVSDLEAAHRLASCWPGEAEALARAFWPGALTLVVPAQAWLPAEVTAGSGSVGIRWPAGELVQGLIRRAGGLLAVTSANRTGEAPATTATEALEALGDIVAFVLDGGGLRRSTASTVVSLLSGQVKVLREGPIDWASLQAVLDR